MAPRLATFAASAAIYLALPACAPLTEGYANNWGGFRSRNEMCESVRTFVRAPLDENGLRRAWFLPFGYGDDYIDFYAPMASSPSDEHATAFYNNRVGQLTHYHLMPEFASIVAGCLSFSREFTREDEASAEGEFRASITDERTDRRIEIRADHCTAAFLVAGEGWQGDVEGAIRGHRPETCDQESQATLP